MLNLLNLTLKLMTEPLSPAAQAVLNAAEDVSGYGKATPLMKAKLAAALRAAANDWRVDIEFIGGVEYIRTSTLDAIAAELEA
jgi:hypothetical protein